MSQEGRTNPGFHAVMMAAAFAEEGLADAALELLRGGAGKRREGQPPATSTPARRKAWIGIGAKGSPARSA